MYLYDSTLSSYTRVPGMASICSLIKIFCKETDGKTNEANRFWCLGLKYTFLSILDSEISNKMYWLVDTVFQFWPLFLWWF